jgi:hypothetical protein
LFRCSSLLNAVNVRVPELRAEGEHAEGVACAGGEPGVRALPDAVGEFRGRELLQRDGVGLEPVAVLVRTFAEEVVAGADEAGGVGGHEAAAKCGR